MTREGFEIDVAYLRDFVENHDYGKECYTRIMAEYDRLHTVYEAAMAYVRINPPQARCGMGWEEYFALQATCEKAEDIEWYQMKT